MCQKVLPLGYLDSSHCWPTEHWSIVDIEFSTVPIAQWVKRHPVSRSSCVQLLAGASLFGTHQNRYFVTHKIQRGKHVPSIVKFGICHGSSGSIKLNKKYKLLFTLSLLSEQPWAYWNLKVITSKYKLNTWKQANMGPGFWVVGSYMYTEVRFLTRSFGSKGHHHVANGTVLIIEYVTYYIITRASKNSVFST